MRTKRKSAKRVRAGKKAARTRKRRGNPTRHRPVVYKFRATSKRKASLRRPAKWRLGRKMGKRGVRKINPSRRKRRRTPSTLKLSKTYFSKQRMVQALMILVGLGGAGALKGFSANFLPVGTAREWYLKLYGAVSIIAGVTLSMKGKRPETKAAGTGMVVFGMYDLLVTNVTPLQKYLPVISTPAVFLPSPAAATDESGEPVEGYGNYGQSTYQSMMGAGIGPGGVEIVGANITRGQASEIVGSDLDLAEALDMEA